MRAAAVSIIAAGLATGAASADFAEARRAASGMGSDAVVRFVTTGAFGGINNGGEFTFESVSGQNFGTFQTFCLELDERLRIGNEYFATVNTEAVSGGAGGPSPDPLDARTAALFDAFQMGSLMFYDFDDDGDGGIGMELDRQQTAAALQAAIWEIEEERSIEATTDNADIRELASYYADTLSQQLVDSGLGNLVRVLNLVSMDGMDAQDVLVVIPLPQAGALASVGLLGLAVRRRRRAV